MKGADNGRGVGGGVGRNGGNAQVRLKNGDTRIRTKFLIILIVKAVAEVGEILMLFNNSRKKQ